MEKILRYPSIAALARDARDSDATRHENQGGDNSWYGGEPAAVSIERAIGGDDRMAAAAERLIDKLQSQLATPERPWIADCAGAYPVVPEYLAGMPDCMRRRTFVETEAAPVRIMVCLTSSAKVTADTMMQRGAAILALTMAMARVRPIELSVFNIGRRGTTESVIAVPINTTPLDLATAAYALTSAGFARRLCYGLAQQHHFGPGGIKWPADYGQDGYLPGLLRRLGGDPERDLIIEPAHIRDTMLADPVAWVNTQIARFQGEAA